MIQTPLIEYYRYHRTWFGENRSDTINVSFKLSLSLVVGLHTWGDTLVVVWKNSLSDAVLMWSFVTIRTNSCSLALARLESPKHTLKHLGQRHTSSELKGAHVRGRLLLGDMVAICLHLSLTVLSAQVSLSISFFRCPSLAVMAQSFFK